MLEINLTLGHLLGAVFLSSILALFFSGENLLKIISWIFLWKLITVTNDIWYVDLYFSILLFCVAQLIFIKFNRLIYKCEI